jgi:hypothetical protein
MNIAQVEAYFFQLGRHLAGVLYMWLKEFFNDGGDDFGGAI